MYDDRLEEVEEFPDRTNMLVVLAYRVLEPEVDPIQHLCPVAVLSIGKDPPLQTLMGHHSVAFTMDQYADAWPEQISTAGEAAAALLLPSGSKTVAGCSNENSDSTESAQIVVFERDFSAPGEIRTPDPQVRSHIPRFP